MIQVCCDDETLTGTTGLDGVSKPPPRINMHGVGICSQMTRTQDCFFTKTAGQRPVFDTVDEIRCATTHFMHTQQTTANSKPVVPQQVSFAGGLLESGCSEGIS